MKSTTTQAPFSTKNRLMVGISLCVLALVVVFATGTLRAYAADEAVTCSAREDIRSADGTRFNPYNGTHITVQGGVAFVDVKNISTTCTYYNVRLASYNVFDNPNTTPASQFIAHQTLFRNDSMQLAPGQTKRIGVPVPSCAYQVDLFHGSTTPATNPDFGNPPLSHTHAIFDWTIAGINNLCGGNPQPAKLTLIKEVINDNGGTKQPTDFTLFVNTTQVTTGQQTTFAPGTYSAREQNLPGYTAGSWTGDCAPDGTVTLAPGDVKTCTIVNNDIPTIIPNTPTCTMSAFPATISIAGTSSLGWTSTNATTATINQGIGSVNAGSGSRVVSPSQTTTYTGTFSGPGGTVTCNATVTVIPTGTLSCAMSANPTSIASGNSSTLSWTSLNALHATIDQGIGAVLVNGNRTVSPTATTTYTGIFSDDDGHSISCQATVAVTPGGQCVPPTPTQASYEVTATVNQPFSYTIPMNGTGPFTVTASTLPGGVSITGNVVSGTPTVTGSFTVHATATNGCGTTDIILVIVIVPGGTPGCVTNCGGGGSFAPKVALFSHPENTPLVAASFISLSEIPYTGLPTSILQALIFLAFLVSITGLAAYGLTRLGIFSFVGSKFGRGSASKDMTVPASVEKNTTAVPFQTESVNIEPPVAIVHVSDVINAHSKDMLARLKTEAVLAAPAVIADERPVRSSAQSLASLSRKAHELQALVSEDGLATVNAMAQDLGQAPERLLAQIVDSAKMYYPREDGWLVLDKKRVNDALTKVMASMAPAFVEWIMKGDRKHVFDFIRSLNRGGQHIGDFVRRVVTELDAVYRTRIEGTVDRFADTRIMDATGHLPNKDLEVIIGELLKGVDESYGSSFTSIRLALSRALDIVSERTVVRSGKYVFEEGSKETTDTPFAEIFKTS